MKDKFDLFNETNIDIEQYDDIKLTNKEKEEMKKRMKKKIQYNKKNNFKRYALVGGLSIVVLGASAFTNETTLAYMQHIGKQIEYFFNKDTGELKPYKIVVDDVVTDRGVKITLNEIMLGDGELFLSLNIDDSKLDKDALGLKKKGGFTGLEDINIKVGDMEFVSITGPSTSERNKDNTTDMVLTCKLDNLDKNGDGKADIENFDLLKNIDLDKTYDIKISINKLDYFLNKNIKTSKEVEVGNMGGEEGTHLNGYISGKWEFNTSINGSNIARDTRLYDVNKNLKLKNKNLDIDAVINEVRVSPTKVRIMYGFKVNKNNLNRSKDGMSTIKFNLEDDKGNILEGLSGIGGVELDYESGKYHESYLEYEINKNVKNVKIIPVIESFGDKTENTIPFENQSVNVDISK